MLLGTLITIAFTALNSRRRIRIQRRDAYSAAVRGILVDLLISSDDFLRFARVISDPANYDMLGMSRTTTLADETEQTMRAFRRDLARCRISVAEAPLRTQCESLSLAFDELAAVVHESVDAFWGSRPPGWSMASRTSAIEKLNLAISETEEVARNLLSPL